MNRDDIARLLLAQRRLFGTQDKLAKALGVSEQAVSQFMSRAKLTPRSDCKILKALRLVEL